MFRQDAQHISSQLWLFAHLPRLIFPSSIPSSLHTSWLSSGYTLPPKIRRCATPSGVLGFPLKKYHFLVILPWIGLVSVHFDDRCRPTVRWRVCWLFYCWGLCHGWCIGNYYLLPASATFEYVGQDAEDSC